MTIKQQGGIFGRNPTFNDLEVDGSLSVDGNLLFTDTSNDRIGINTSSPGTTLDVNGGSTTQLRLTAADSTSASIINFGDQANVAVGRIIYSHVTDSFSFKTNNVNNRLTIDSSGNVTVGNGNLVMGTSGSGIDFSATGDITGVTSELLDSYEEGEFDVTLTPTTSGTITLGSSYNKGRYTFVGRLLTVTGFVIVDSVSSPVGNVRLSLPIAIGDGTEASGRIGGSVLYYNGSSDVVVGYNGVETNSYVQLFTNAASVASGHAVHFSITYMF
jgi:hypothetical protein